MSNDGDMRERHGRVLAELAEAGMAMVRRLSQAMEATQDVQTQVQLGLAFHRVSRAVRQTMALEFRLSQEARRADLGLGPTRPPKPKPTAASSPEPAPPSPAPERVGWSEHERDDSDEALDALDELLEADELDIEAVHDAVEASMARIRRDIAADPLLVKAGVLPAGPPAAPPPQRRRSELMGGAALARPPNLPFPYSGKGGAFADPPAAGKSEGWKAKAAGKAVRSSA